jgi:NADPH-dependent curcumin reductase CurA
MIEDKCFRWTEEPVVQPGADGEVLVRNLLVSLDPTQRGWISRDTYLPAVKIGEVMRSGASGRVVASRHPDYAVGDVVTGLLGWQDYALVKPTSGGMLTKLPPGVPLELAMSTLGTTGITAYFGVTEIGRVKSGETFIVSGAAGATGSVAGQIARILGCRVVGIAGGKDKCEWLLGEAKLDAVIDYKSEDVAARLRELCPKGIDVYFDNVGGEILDAALANLAMRGRVVLCGAIATYNDTTLAPGPKNYLNLIVKRGRMEGFIVLDYLPRAMEAVAKLFEWVGAGQIKDRVDVMHGLENAPKALRRLFTGENAGKQLLRIAE